MSPERWQLIKEIFSTAIDLQSQDREEYLQMACAGETALRKEVDRLLSAQSDSRAPSISPIKIEMKTLTDDGTLPHTIFAPGKILASRFRIERYIASGGMGSVYEAYDLVLREKIALKTIRLARETSLASVELLKTEARRARRVNSENVCRVFDFVLHQDPTSEVTFLTMELLSGETLSDRIQKQGPFSPASAKPILEQLINGLECAHRVRIVHRDFKSRNVILCDNPDGSLRAVITDFGLAYRTVDGSDPTMSGLELNLTAGTPAYMAPEQVLGKIPTVATDVYAFGVVAYEMITGRVPFEGATPSATAHMRLTVPPVAPTAIVPTLPQCWNSAILRCLEVQPENRFPKVSDFLLALSPKEPLSTAFTSRRNFAIGLVLSAIGIGSVIGIETLRDRRRLKDLKIAVLPFQNTDPSASAPYFNDGFTEELIALLSRSPELKVIARESSFRWRDTSSSPKQIAEMLGVSLLVQGKLLRHNGKLKADVALLNTSAGVNLWSHSYEEPEGRLEHMEYDIAKSITSSVSATLPQQIQSNTAPLPILDAHELYWMGQFHFHNRTNDDLMRAIECFERAIAKNPSYSEPYTGLADVYCVLAEWNAMPPVKALLLAKTSAEKAVSLNAKLADAQVSLAQVISLYDRDFEGAEEHFKLGLRLNINLVKGHQWYSYMLLKERRFEESMFHARRALELDPLSIPANQNLAALFHYLKEDDQMIRQYRKVLELQPHHTFAHLIIAEELARKGLESEAFRELDGIDISQKNDVLVLRTLGEINALLNRRGEAEKYLRELVVRKSLGGVSSSYIAGIYAMLGERDSAFVWLERAFIEKDGFLSLIQVYPAFDSLRLDPRYSGLVLRLGFKKRTA